MRTPLLSVLLAALANLSPTPSCAQGSQPVAPVRPVTETYFGTPVVDNYRYMEKLDDPEVQNWMKAQATYTRHVLDGLPGRAALLDRITAVLVFDSATAGPMLAGARGATDTARQRVYAWEGGEVVVRMRSVSGELQLDGQLLPDSDDPALFTMALVVDGEQVGAATPVDGVGEFAVAGQPGRVASLVARGEAFEIEFGPFEVSD